MKMRRLVSRGRRMVCRRTMLCGARCHCPLLILCETVDHEDRTGEEKEKEEKEKKRRRMKGKGRKAERSVV